MGDKNTRKNLEHLLFPVLDRLTFFPDHSLLSQFPVGRRIIDLSKEIGGLEPIFKELTAQDYFDSAIVPIPSLEQRLAGTLIAQAGMRGEKRFELSKPGTRKTIGVLSAIPVINEVMLPRLGYDPGTRVQTLVACPSYIIPTWIREAERILKDPNMVVVTADNRDYALKRARDEDVDLLLLGYSLSFRNSGIARVTADPKTLRDRFIELMYSVSEREEAVDLLSERIGEERARKIAARTPRLNDLLKKIALEEEKSRSSGVTEFLQEQVFVPEEKGGRPSYVILDEIHNVLSPTSKTAIAIGDLFRSARFGVQVSGTGMRKGLNDLSFSAYLNGRVDDPKDFPSIVKGDPRVIRGMLELDANPIRTLTEVDPDVPEPELETCFYSLDQDEIELWTGLTNSGLFDGKELYLLGTYLHTLPYKLLPDNLNGNGKGKSDRTSDSRSLFERVEEFFDQNPNLENIAKTKKPSKLVELERIVDNAKKYGKKVIVVCKYSSQLTEFLEDSLKGQGVVRIDNSSKPDPQEIELTHDDVERLAFQGELEQQQKYKSHLTLRQREILGISANRIYNPSDRGLRLLEFQTNPDATVCVTTYGVLREGVDAQEASVIVEYGISTEPHETEQLRARSVRSGQRKKVKIHRLVGITSQISDQENFGLEVSKVELHDYREERIQSALFGDNPGVDELKELFDPRRDSSTAKIKRAMAESPKTILAMMFGSCVERGVGYFYKLMSSYQNALFLAKNYNHAWDKSTSANSARLETAILSALEELRGQKFEEVLSLASGPASLSRMSGRRSTCVDINGFQLAFGEEATLRAGLDNKYLLGSFTDLRRLVDLSDIRSKGDISSMVFNPTSNPESRVGIETESQDLVELGFALYYTLPEERRRVVAEVNRTLKTGGYFMLMNPTSRFDPECHANFYADIQAYGFEIDTQLSGTYTSPNIISEDEGKKDSFKVHCVIARKVSSLDSRVLESGEKEENREIDGENPPQFAMQPQYKVVEVSGRRRKRKSEREKGQFKGFICQDFVNMTTGVRLEDGTVQGISSPDWYKGVTDAITSLPEDAYQDLLDQLQRIGTNLNGGEANE